MSEVKLTSEDQKILIEANNLYLFDWRENDDDEATAGWRHPGYFLEVGQPNDFQKLVDAGLMEKGANPDYVTYRISELGMEEVAKFEAQAAPAADTPAAVQAVGAGGEVSDYSRGYRAGIVDGYTGVDATDDSGYSELLDELSGRIKGLERENQRLRDAHKQIVVVWKLWEEGVMNDLTAVVRMKTIAETAQQPTAAGTGDGD